MGDSKEKRQKLSNKEFGAYREAVKEEGLPRYLSSEGRPNKALKIMWDLREKYGFGIRLATKITEDGYLEYDVAK